MTNSRKPLVTTLSFVVDGHGDLTKKFLNPHQLGSMASARLQLMPALKSIQKLGYEVSIHSLHSDYPQDISELKKSDICLIGKMSANKPKLVDSMAVANLAAITRLKNKGALIVTQHCDNIFHHQDNLKDFYEDLFKLSDCIIYPCKALRELTHSYVNSSTREYIVPDPWQLENSHQPRDLKDGETLRIIWFGSNKNIHYLWEHIPKILDNITYNGKIELTILAQRWAIDKIKKCFKSLNKSYPNWLIRFVLWQINQQPQQLEAEISRAHICLVPSDPRDPLKIGVSHNRIVDATKGGCIVVASPMKSYLELSEIAVLNESIPDALSYSIINYKDLTKQLITKRTDSLEEFSPMNNLKNWNKTWKSILTTS